MSQSDRTQLDQLLSYLQIDPQNIALLEDTAQAAANCHDVPTTSVMIERLKALGPLSIAMRALEGRLLMGSGRFEEAVKLYRGLLEQLPDDTGAKSSLAWALVQIGQIEAALVHLDEDTTAVWPQAAELRLRLLHSTGAFDQAEAELQSLIAFHPQHEGLLAAASVLSIDLENSEVARDLAQRAGDQADAHATLGLLNLDAVEIDAAESQFERALQQKPDLARAWIGKGLVAMARNSPQDAILPLARGAEIFGDHLGTWIALGWAELLSGDQMGAERTFHRALDLDRTFAESHGSLAVIEALKGNFDAARRGVETAMRLDASSFSGVFASVLIATAQGREDAAQKIFDRALDTPVQANGPTLREMISRFARSS
ncbi:MAG: hypothetical protein RL145_2228 [Pseudomonadota bacterium]|jgi:tetratricopeptide (TPR) repeat protein